jgi:hypothetical protein
VQALYVVFLLQDTLLGILSSGIALFQEDKRSVSCSTFQIYTAEILLLLLSSLILVDTDLHEVLEEGVTSTST